MVQPRQEQLQDLAGSVSGVGSTNTLTVFKQDVNADGYRIYNLANPTDLSDAATKSYVDGYGMITVSTSAEGDLSGTYPNPTVIDLTISGEEHGSILYYNGSNWVHLAPSTDGYALITHGVGANPTWSYISSQVGSGDVVGPSSSTDNSIAVFDGLTGKLLKNSTITVSATPILPTDVATKAYVDGYGFASNMPVGGDLDGYLPNPTVVAATIFGGTRIEWGSISDTQLIKRDADTFIGYTLPTSFPPNGQAGGDLDGYYPNPTVKDLTITGEQQGSIIYYNGSNWSQLPPSTDGYYLKTRGIGANPEWAYVSASSGSGDVVGPSSSTNNAIARFDLATGKLIKNSVVTIDDSGNFDNVNYIDFTPLEPTLVPDSTEGRVFWDGYNHTLAIRPGYGGVTQQVGQELYIIGLNKTGADIPNGTPVYYAGVQGTRVKIAPASTLNAMTSQLVGVTTHDIAKNQEGVVTTFGLINDVDTSAYNDGDPLYLTSTPGVMATTITGQYPISVGVVLVANAGEGKILIDIRTFPLIRRLWDVQNGLPIDGYHLLANGNFWVGSNFRTDVASAVTHIQAAGDLDGYYPNPTVKDLTITGEQQGSILYYNGSNWVQLPPSDDGYLLTTQGTGANPTWEKLDGYTISINYTPSTYTPTANTIGGHFIGISNYLASLGLDQVQEKFTATLGQTSFTLGQLPEKNTAVQMYINGIKQIYTTDYVVSGTAVTYYSTTLIAGDVVEFWYLINSATIARSYSDGYVNIIAPTQITTNENNYNPTGFSSADAVFLNANTAVDITGFESSALTHMKKKVYNIGTSNITLKYQSTSSNEANRMIIPGQTDLVLQQDDIVDMLYDYINSRWRLG